MIPRRRPVTIIAGFRVQDGILLCSDTEWSGAGKIYQQKIFSHFFRGGAIAFAVAGNEANARMAIEDCQYAIDAARKKPYTPKELTAIVREAVRATHKKYVDQRPDTEKEAAWFELIIGFALKSGYRQLLASRAPGVLPVDRFATQGAGWQVARPIIDMAYDPNMRIKDAVIVAMQAMAAAKLQVEGVGGHSQFLVMGEQFVSDLIGHDPKGTERLIVEYERAAERLLLGAGDFDLDERAFRERVLNFEQLVTNLRAEWATASAPYRELIEGLAKPAPCQLVSSWSGK